MKKILEKINLKQLLKDYLPSIVFLILFACFCFYDTGYSIYKPGGIIDESQRIEGDNLYKSKGTFNMAYVGYVKGNLPFYLIAKILPSWKLVKNETITANEIEQIVETQKRDEINYMAAISNATLVAYKEANVEFELVNTDNYVVYKTEEAKCDVEIGDIITNYDNHKYTNTYDLIGYITKLKGNNLTLKTFSKKEIECTLYEQEQRRMLGISIQPVSEYKSKYNIKVRTKSSESGPSGGLIMALSIYDKLTKEDLTKGRKIVGTGTIDGEGNVGDIGSVTYKLAAANKEKADIFLVPEGNYEEALEYAKEHKYKLKLVKVNTFKEAIDYLKEN